MAMHTPPHPGEFIQATYMEPFDISCRFLATKLNVAASTLNRVLTMKSGVSPEMALRLSKALGRSPESWLAMQDAYDLWQAKKACQAW
jgi:addiction module HigA family antidote